jgi:hypothetical protein
MGILQARYIVTILIVSGVLVATFLPIISYKLTVPVHGFPYTQAGYSTCQSEYGQIVNIGNGRAINITDQKGFQKCLDMYRLPPINITGSASLMYKFLGLGIPPFPRMVTVSEDTFYAVLYITGAKIVAAEEVHPNTLFNPPGITINNISLSVGSFGESNVTTSFTNGNGQTIYGAQIILSIPGNSGNSTDSNGITWINDSLGGTLGLCFSGRQLQNVTPGGSCTTTLTPVLSISRGSSFRYSVEVRGILGDQYFVSRRSFSYTLPAQAIDQAWVAKFISLLSSARNNSTLTESSTLDSFAALRFGTAVKQPNISDYGLSADTSSFFGANGTPPSIVEVLLYPAGQDPYSYAAFIHGSAPGHWSALTDRNYAHFGYYVGTGPYEFVKFPCSVSEIPGPGINITQYFTAAGCTVRTQQTTWLVIIMGS